MSLQLGIVITIGAQFLRTHMLESFLIFHRLTQVKFTLTKMTQIQRTLAFVLTHAIDAHSSQPLDPLDYYPTPQDPYTEFVSQGLDSYDNYPTPQDPYTKEFVGESSDLSGTDTHDNEFVSHGLDSYDNYPTPPYKTYKRWHKEPKREKECFTNWCKRNKFKQKKPKGEKECLTIRCKYFNKGKKPEQKIPQGGKECLTNWCKHKYSQGLKPKGKKPKGKNLKRKKPKDLEELF